MNTQRHKSSSLNQSNNYETTSTATAFSAADENLHSKPARLQAPGLVLLAGLAVAALAFSTTLFPWVQAHVNGVLGEQNLDITGSRAAPAVSALAMVALAAPLAARIAPSAFAVCYRICKFRIRGGYYFFCAVGGDESRRCGCN